MRWRRYNELAYEFRATSLPVRDGEISLSVVPKGTTNKLAGLFFTLSPLLLSVMQGSYKYKLLSRWFNPTQNRTPSLPFQKQTLYPFGHLSCNHFIWFTILPPSELIGKCAVDTLTSENGILLLEKFLNDYFFTFT